MRLIVFQSLFWWKYCPGRGGPRHHGGLVEVSILVLVEVLPWGLIPLPSAAIGAAVSILVLVEVLPWADHAAIESKRSHMFQSLFWWKYCPGPGGCLPGHKKPPRPGFNPCSGGSIALGWDPTGRRP